MPLEAIAAASVGTPYLWEGFILFVLLMLALDLGVFNRKEHVIGFKEAAGWSVLWVALSLCFSGFIWWQFGQEKAMDYLSGYFIEKSLSVDNIFVFVVIFSSLKVPALYQHRVLYWGILSALVLRAAMIFAGVGLLNKFAWLMYVFGGFLIVTGVKLFINREHEEEREEAEASTLMRFVRRVVPTTDKFEGHNFFTRIDGKRLATPLFSALVLIELSDVIFALDSIPAIFGVTTDPFIIFTSNIFAILGLRSLFFLVAGMLDKFSYLKVGLSGVLVFVGVKMVLGEAEVLHINSMVSLGVILAMLGISIAASLMKASGDETKSAEP